MKRVTMIAALSGMAVIVAWAVYRQATLQARFDAIADRMNQGEVVAILGEPWQKNLCNPGIFDSITEPDCEEFVYASPFAPLIPEYPVVRFNANKKVYWKYLYQSP